jgi:Protein of unknown function (DUF2934)
MSSSEKHIREKAYELWERAGRPGGRDDEFWFAAVRELEVEPAAVEKVAEEDAPSVAPKEVRANGDSSTRRRRSAKAG